MALVTLQTIFQDAFPAYEQRHALPAHVRRAAHALMQCRTAALGGHIQACPDGHVARVWYNSCRHRSCPQCAYLQTERWLALQRARLLACDHYHVIFTLPHELNPLWLANVPVMTTLLFQAVRDTLSTLLADPKYLGAQPGILAALHTWSQTLVLHPHVHCLVTGGGLTADGSWKALLCSPHDCQSSSAIGSDASQRAPTVCDPQVSQISPGRHRLDGSQAPHGYTSSESRRCA